MANTMIKGIKKKYKPWLPTLYVFHSSVTKEFMSLLDDGTAIDFYSLTSTENFNVDLIQDHQFGLNAGFQKAYESYIHNHQG